MLFKDDPRFGDLAHLVGTNVLVRLYGEPELDPYNPFAAPQSSGKCLRGSLVAVSENTLSVDGVSFRADHVSNVGVFIDHDKREFPFLKLHRGHRDDYSYGA